MPLGSSDDILIFGGSYDPVHHGHLIVARGVAEKLGSTRVVLIPAKVSPHKESTAASGEQRLAMLRLAVEGDPLFEISDTELTRQTPSYSIETVEHFLARGVAQPTLVIGADSLSDLPRWHRAEELLDKARIVIAPRPPSGKAEIERILQELRGELDESRIERLRGSVVSSPLIDISATDIRRRVAEGRAIRYLVPPAVEQYIRQHGLYR
jgi:nicotinate-nucleotide adenylyltransferase